MNSELTDLAREATTADGYHLMRGMTLRISLDFEGEPANTTVTVLQATLFLLSKGETEQAEDTLRRHLREIVGGEG